MNNYTFKLLEEKDKGYPEREVDVQFNDNRLIKILVDYRMEVRPADLLLVLKHRKTNNPLPSKVLNILKSSALAELV